MRASPSIRPVLPKPREARAWAFAACTAALWFGVLWRVSFTAPARSLAPEAVAAAGLATQLAFTAFEASLGVAIWAALGRCVRWGELASALLTASAAEACAVGLAAGETALPEGWRVALAGPRAAADHVAPSAFAHAFAGLGLLTLLRLLLATQAHAAALARCPGRALSLTRRWRDAALMVLVFYAASRLALWWGLDIVRGRSFEP